jgi:hypothetical protein
VIFNVAGFAIYFNPEKICGFRQYFELITKSDYGNIHLISRDYEIIITNGMGGRAKKDIYYSYKFI